MNARDYKQFYPDGIYHIFNRGNNRAEVFIDEEDYFFFLKRLKLQLGVESRESALGERLKLLPIGAFELYSYCLMPNHFHLMLKQKTNIPVTKLMTNVCTAYAKYFNKKYDRVGHVFQDAFKAKNVENDQYALYLSAYIHNNPNSPETYKYSSYLDYLGIRLGTLCKKDFLLNFTDSSIDEYRKFVNSFDEKQTDLIAPLLFEK